MAGQTHERYGCVSLTLLAALLAQSQQHNHSPMQTTAAVVVAQATRSFSRIVNTRSTEAEMWHATPCGNRSRRYSPATVPCRATMTETHEHFHRFFLSDTK